MILNSGSMSLPSLPGSNDAYPSLAEAYTTGNSSWSSSAPSSMNRSSTSSTTSAGLASGLSILLTTTMGFKFNWSAFLKTKRVCGIGPSNASTRSSTPSTILSDLSTSPPKSACPGVSTIFIFIFLYLTDVFFASMVIPRSLSRSLESITRSCTCSFSLKMPLWRSIASTRVVFP